jgi:hypothetical protein
MVVLESELNISLCIRGDLPTIFFFCYGKVYLKGVNPYGRV